MIVDTERMVLPFQPLTVAFKDVQYFVDTPMVSKLNHWYIITIMNLYIEEDDFIICSFCSGNEKAWV